MEILLAIIGMLLIALFFAGIIEGISPKQYKPPSPEEEQEWLRRNYNMTEEEIEDYLRPRS